MESVLREEESIHIRWEGFLKDKESGESREELRRYDRSRRRRESETDWNEVDEVK